MVACTRTRPLYSGAASMRHDDSLPCSQATSPVAFKITLENGFHDSVTLLLRSAASAMWPRQGTSSAPSRRAARSTGGCPCRSRSDRRPSTARSLHGWLPTSPGRAQYPSPRAGTSATTTNPGPRGRQSTRRGSGSPLRKTQPSEEEAGKGLKPLHRLETLAVGEVSTRRLSAVRPLHEDVDRPPQRLTSPRQIRHLVPAHALQHRLYIRVVRMRTRPLLRCIPL